MRGAPRQTAGIAAPLAALAAALALAALLEYLARTPASGLVEPPPPPAAPPSELRVAGGLGWQVTAVRSAHHVLVVEVETDRLAEAGAIARQLVEQPAVVQLGCGKTGVGEKLGTRSVDAQKVAQHRRVGIAGAGQLARMTCLAAWPLGIRVGVLGSSDEPAAGPAAGVVTGSWQDAAAIGRALGCSRG